MTMSRLPGTTDRRVHPAEWVLLSAAFVWSGLLFAAATLLPVYEGSSAEQTAENPEEIVTHFSHTLVEENGTGVLIVIGVPMLLTISLAIALRLRGARRGAGPLAWTITCSLGAFNLLAMLSLGILILPVTGCIVAACLIHQFRPIDTPQLIAST